ncbi:MAG: hypothetical protein ABIY56_00040 [Dokdonella sp.]
MLLHADGKPHQAHALIGRDGVLVLSDVCLSERQALELRHGQMTHQPHRGALGVKRVLVTVTLVED